MANAIFCRDDENILIGGTPAGSAALSSYHREDVISRLPSRRVLYGSTSVTYSVLLSSAKTGAIAILPVSNCGPAVATLTNGAGLSTAYPIPALPEDNIPLSAILDFSALSNRSSNTWNLVIAANTANVLLGGGFGIYASKRQLPGRNYAYGWTEIETDFVIAHKNYYGTELRYPLTTRERLFEYQFKPTDADLDALRSWHRANRGQPGVFWPNPSVNEAHYGVWEEFRVTRSIVPSCHALTMTFRELVKGKPVA